MKRFGAIIAVIIIVISTLTPLWGTQPAQAQTKNPKSNATTIPIISWVEMSDVFKDRQNEKNSGDFWLGPESGGVKTIEQYQTKAKISAYLVMNDIFSPPEDTKKNGRLDNEDYLGGWTTILDQEKLWLPVDKDDGIFLEIFEVPKDVKKTEDEILNGGAQYAIKKGGPYYSTDKIKIIDPISGNPINVTYSGEDFKTNFVNKWNIGVFFWAINPTQNFFGKRTISTNIILTDLKPDTKYYYRLVLEERFSGDSATTQITENTSFTTTAKGTRDPTPEQLQADNASSNGSSEAGNKVSGELFGQSIACEITDPGTWGGCLALLYYNTIYRISSFFLRGAAGLMDAFMAISLSSTMYQNSFIETGWTIVRDVCNIFFIFILLWTAFKMVINDSQYHANRVIVNIVVIGLLINFSLFFSRVIIDMGNISARVFYNQIRITGSGQDQTDEVAKSLKSTDIRPKAISLALANGLSLTSIQNTGYEKLSEENGGTVDTGAVWLILLLGTIVNLVAMWIFVKVAFAFLGRVLSLWVGMVLSPFAFTSTIIEHGPLEHIENLSWNDWLKNMLSAAFYPALYLFFIFLVILLIQSDFSANIVQDYNSLTATPFLIMTLFKFMFIIGLLVMSGRIAQRMSGAFGGGVSAFAGKAASFLGGAAVGVATGGLALGARGLMGGGKAAAWLGGKDSTDWKLAAQGDEAGLSKLRNMNEFKGMTDFEIRQKAENRIKTAQKKATRSYDIRNTAAGNFITKTTGLDMNAGLSKTLLGANVTQGGAQSAINRRAYKEAQFIESISLTKEQRKEKQDEIKTKEEKLKQEEKEIRDKIEELTKENKNITERAQAGAGLTTDPANLIQNQNNIKQLEKELSDPQTNTVLAGSILGKTTPDAQAKFSESAKNRSDLKKDIKELKVETSRDAVRTYAQFMHHNTDAGFSLGTSGRQARSLFRSNIKGGFLNYSWRTFGRELGDRLMGGLRGGLTTAITGSMLGPGGTIAGAVVGSVNGLMGGGVLPAIQRSMQGFAKSTYTYRKEVVHAMEAGHYHAPHDKPVYKSPNKGLFDIFSGLGSSGGGGNSSGGGAKHDDHAHH